MKTFRPEAWLPTTKKEVEARGWDYIDVILFSGDAYGIILRLVLLLSDVPWKPLDCGWYCSAAGLAR